MVFYLESWFSWLWGRMRKTLKNNKTDSRKKLKSEEKEKQRTRGKSRNKNTYLSLVLNLLENIS